eukprot:INCI7168.3.p1 GENE.INCI7168.3~~INCI7168.3.p1  ORF type:complete len:153 (-),score=33.76 INCI7168.3:1989-2447(-)
MFSNLATAAAAAGALLVVKSAVITLLQVRERLNSGNFGSPEDRGSFLRFIFPVLGAGPSLGGVETINRVQRVLDNNVHNEPIFVALVAAAAAAGVAPADATTCVQVFLGARAVHNIVYLAGNKVNAGLRTVSYLVGFSTAAYVAVGVLRNVM